MGSNTLLRKQCFKKSVLVLFLISLLPSCAIRYKGIKGIDTDGRKHSSIGYSDKTIVKFPEYYSNYNKGVDKITPLLFDKEPKVTWKIEQINYKKVPFAPMCGNGFVIPMLVSFVTFGIIPVQLTDELKGEMVIKNQETDESRTIKFHAKQTSSYSLWNKLKIGKDPEWTGKEKFQNDEYYRRFVESKLPKD